MLNEDKCRFVSWRQFLDFRKETAQSRRYIRSNASERFLEAVAATCRNRIREIEKGRTLWRAQLGNSWQADAELGEKRPRPHQAARMKPMEDRAREGRVNPKGIPCLYLATTRETAMSEVRPWIGSMISLGRFEVVRTLELVDCSVAHDERPFFDHEPSYADIEGAVWAHIDRAFSLPVTPNHDTADYAATQILAELFRSEGYDGVLYKSAVGADGYNIALFDLSTARYMDADIFEAKTVQYEFLEIK